MPSNGSNLGYWISGTAAFIGFIGLVYRHQANKSNRRRNETAVAALENSIRDQLNKSRDKISDLALQISNVTNGRDPGSLTEAEKRRIEDITKLNIEAHERWLNVYEDACSKFLSNQLSPDWFKEVLADEVKTLIEETKPDNIFISPFLFPRAKTQFIKIWSAYDTLTGKPLSSLQI